MLKTTRFILLFLLSCAVLACSGSSQTAEPSSPGTAETQASADGTEAAAAAPATTATPAGDESNARATSGPAPAASSEIATMSKEEFLVGFKGFMLAMADVLKANQGDCDAMAEALRPVMADAPAYKARVEELERDPETKAWLDEQGKAMVNDVMPAMMEAMAAAEACKDHPGVAKEMQAL